MPYTDEQLEEIKKAVSAKEEENELLAKAKKLGIKVPKLKKSKKSSSDDEEENDEENEDDDKKPKEDDKIADAFGRLADILGKTSKGKKSKKDDNDNDEEGYDDEEDEAIYG